MNAQGPFRMWPYGGGRWPYAVLDVLLASLVGLCVLFEARIGRVDAVSAYPLKPTWGRGQDWLIVGYGMPATGRRRREFLSPDGASARRADTIMLLHLPHDAGKPTLLSLPPGTYAPIPGSGPGSLGTAFARGGPALLVRTFEAATHTSIERYLGIDLRGLAAMVDAVGGVRPCDATPPRPRGGRPRRPADCPALSGERTLDYLRARESARPELERAERERRLVTALIDKAADALTAFDPARSIGLARAFFGTVLVDEDHHLYDLLRLAFALRTTGLTAVTVSTSKGGSLPGVGPVVIWDQVLMGRLISSLAMDHPVPDGLIRP